MNWQRKVHCVSRKIPGSAPQGLSQWCHQDGYKFAVDQIVPTVVHFAQLSSRLFVEHIAWINVDPVRWRVYVLPVLNGLPWEFSAGLFIQDISPHPRGRGKFCLNKMNDLIDCVRRWSNNSAGHFMAPIWSISQYILS